MLKMHVAAFLASIASYAELSLLNKQEKMPLRHDRCPYGSAKKPLRRLLLLLLLCAGLLYPSQGFCNAGFIGGDIKIVKKQDSGKTIDVKVGDVIQIELESLGSAGYEWFTDSVDTRYVELMSHSTKATSEKDKIGAPVLSVWRFRALSKGKTEIRMSHYRIWEGKEQASDNFHMQLNIH